MMGFIFMVAVYLEVCDCNENQNIENMINAKGSENIEGLQNLASMYDKGVMVLSGLQVTKSLRVGNINIIPLDDGVIALYGNNADKKMILGIKDDGIGIMSKGSINMLAEDSVNIVSEKDIGIIAKGTGGLFASQTLNLGAEKDMNVAVTGDINTESKGNVTISADGTFDMNGKTHVAANQQPVMKYGDTYLLSEDPNVIISGNTPMAQRRVSSRAL